MYTGHDPTITGVRMVGAHSCVNTGWANIMNIVNIVKTGMVQFSYIAWIVRDTALVIVEI